MKYRTAALLLAALFLVFFGIIMIYSTSSLLALEKYGSADYFLKRQLIGACLGLCVMFIAMSIPLEMIHKYALWIYSLSLTLLIALYVPGIGHSVGGATRWIRILGVSIQPTEFMKYALLIYLSSWISQNIQNIHSLKYGLIIPGIISCIPLSLIFLQPDLGNCVVIASVLLMIVFVSGAPFKYIFFIGLSSLPLLSWAIMSVAYRRNRVLAFLDPWQDPSGSGFQLIQSFIALGSGGISGLGLGQSRQKMYYLPEAHTDFIFSIIGEELGFIGAVIILLAFCLLIICGIHIVQKAPDYFTHLLSLGIVSFIAIPCIINIAVVTGSIPTKGIPLPFVSYGSSNLIMNMLGIGLLINISMIKTKTIKSKRKKVYRVRQ